MNKPLNLTNKQFGKLFVTSRADNNKFGQSQWAVKCKCGNESVVAGSKLVSGHTQSCGCLAVETCTKRSTKHGQASRAGKSREYNAWREMKRRCLNPHSKSYSLYGGKGVTVCPEWVDSFEVFFSHVGHCPDKYELDRVDNSKGYEPNNVRWSSETTQSRNRGYCKLDEVKAEAIRQDSRSSRAVAKEYEVVKSTVLRVKRGKTWKKED